MVNSLPQVDGLYPWPYDGTLQPAGTALLVLGMQQDMVRPEGWLGCCGANLSSIQGIVPGIAALAGACRSTGIPVFLGRECHRPDLQDVPPNKMWRAVRNGAGIGEVGALGRHLVRGEPGNEIMPELDVQPSDIVVDTPGKSAFFATDLDQVLRLKARQNLIICGATTDGLVQATLRDANDRGYECLVISDLCATTDPNLHQEQIGMFALAGGLWGSVATFKQLMTALEAA